MGPDKDAKCGLQGTQKRVLRPLKGARGKIPFAFVMSEANADGDQGKMSRCSCGRDFLVLRREESEIRGNKRYGLANPGRIVGTMGDWRVLVLQAIGLGIFACTGSSENAQTEPIVYGWEKQYVRGRGRVQQKVDASGQVGKHVMCDGFSAVARTKPLASKCQLVRQDRVEIVGVFGTMSLQETAAYQL